MKGPSKRAVARALGVTLSALQLAEKTGRVDLTPPRDVERIRAAWLASSNVTAPSSLANRTTGDDAAEPLAVARARKERALASLRELELAERAKLLVPAADVEATWAKLVTNAKTRLLALPVRLKHVIPHLTPADLGTVEQLIREALEELAA